MNQVYFYAAGWPAGTKRLNARLNPFMNQVYFYLTKYALGVLGGLVSVLIPL